jgi:hypothetical protein
MKTLDYSDIPKYAIKAVDSDTPFRVINFGDFEIRLYWTKRGVNGFQVISVIFYCSSFCYAYKTAGGNYCKESSSLEHIWAAIGSSPLLESDTINRDYFIGGNFYKVPSDHIIKSEGV